MPGDLQQRLTDDMKTALKAGEKDRLSVIRMLLSDVKNIDLDPKKPTAEQVVSAYAKKLRKSSEEYEKLGKQDEVKKLKFEMVSELVPSSSLFQLSEDAKKRSADEMKVSSTRPFCVLGPVLSDNCRRLKPA